MKDFISLHDCTREQIEDLIKLAIQLKAELKSGVPQRPASSMISSAV